jgi:hypothetical protein
LIPLVSAEFIYQAMVFVICWGWLKSPGPTDGGEVPRHFRVRSYPMKELSVFIDESGDFETYETHSIVV